MRKRISLAIAMLMIAGCSSPPPAPIPDGLLMPKAGSARVVIYYPKGIIGSRAKASTRLDGLASCTLPSGGFITRDVAPGTMPLAAGFCGSNNFSYLTLHLAAKNIYFVRIVPYDASLTGILSGYRRPPEQKIVQLTPNTTPVAEPPFSVELVDRTTALHEMQGLVPSEP